MTRTERVARAIAAELGDDFDAAFQDKPAWIAARGGEPFRDVNMPFKSDYLNAATAALTAIDEERDALIIDRLQRLKHKTMPKQQWDAINAVIELLEARSLSSVSREEN